MKKTAILCLFLLSCVTDDNDAIKALTDLGFTDIVITDRTATLTHWYGCSDDDGTAYSAQAKNPAGKTVNMTVCCGGFGNVKGCTVRSK